MQSDPISLFTCEKKWISLFTCEKKWIEPNRMYVEKGKTEEIYMLICFYGFALFYFRIIK